MVTQTVRRATLPFRGVRPFEAVRDLGAVSRLLGQAFHEDLDFWSQIPWLRNLGAAWWLTYLTMPDSFHGFVYEEEQRVIGNVTLSVDDARRGCWLISNVAVDEKYRRRGIARQLMQTALAEAQQHGAARVLLSVRPHNVGAIELYEKLGFASVDTEMNFVCTRPRLLPASSLSLRRLNFSEHRAAFELARAGLDEGAKMFRPLQISDYVLYWDEYLAESVLDFFIGQVTERWGYFDEARLCATLRLRAQRIGTPHSFDIRVARDWRGRLEDDLLSFVLARLAQFPHRDISARMLTSHTELVEALGRAGFISTRGLKFMAKIL